MYIDLLKTLPLRVDHNQFKGGDDGVLLACRGEHVILVGLARDVDPEDFFGALPVSTWRKHGTGRER